MNSRKKPALGRNLSAMLSPSTLDEVRHPAGGELRDLPLDVIRPGRYQPRSVFDEEKRAELADSIRAQGVVQPVVVRPVGDDAYELIAGELAGPHEARVIAGSVLSGRQAVGSRAFLGRFDKCRFIDRHQHGFKKVRFVAMYDNVYLVLFKNTHIHFDTDRRRGSEKNIGYFRGYHRSSPSICKCSSTALFGDIFIMLVHAHG